MKERLTSSITSLGSIKDSATAKISNWDRPGGTLGKVVAAALIIGGVALVYTILPFLITLASNALTLALLCGAIAGLGFLVTNKKFRGMFSNLYFMLMRKLTGLVIELDPIAILEKKIKEMKERIELMRESAISVRKQYLTNERKIIEKKEKVKWHLSRAIEMKKRGRESDAGLEAANANFNKKIAEKYISNNDDLLKWMDMLEKMIEYADFTIRKTEAEVEFKKEEYNAIKEQHKAFSSFKSIMGGNPDELEDFTRAMDIMAEDMDSKIAEMDYYLTHTGGIIDNMDIDKGIMGSEAEKLLNEFKEKGLEGIFEGKQVIDIKAGRESVSLDDVKSLEAQLKETPSLVESTVNR